MLLGGGLDHRAGVDRVADLGLERAPGIGAATGARSWSTALDRGSRTEAYRIAVRSRR